MAELRCGRCSAPLKPAARYCGQCGGEIDRRSKLDDFGWGITIAVGVIVAGLIVLGFVAVIARGT